MVGEMIGKARDWLARPSWDQAFGLVHRLDRLRESYVERRYGLDYSRIVAHDDLSPVDENSLAHATSYQASSSTLLKLVLSEAAKTEAVFENFIDIGSGKGKICIEARRSGRFRRVVGIDFSQELVGIARANAAKCGCADEIEFVCADARSYLVPDAANLIYLYNPFDERMLSTFIENNIDNFRRCGSCIAYVTDVHRNAIVGLGFETVYRSQMLQISLFAARTS